MRFSIELFEQFRIERKRSRAGVSTKKFSAKFKIVILGDPNSISEIEISWFPAALTTWQCGNGATAHFENRFSEISKWRRRGSLTRDRFERRLFERFNTSRFTKSAAKFERDEPLKAAKYESYYMTHIWCYLMKISQLCLIDQVSVKTCDWIKIILLGVGVARIFFDWIFQNPSWGFWSIREHQRGEHESMEKNFDMIPMFSLTLK